MKLYFAIQLKKLFLSPALVENKMELDNDSVDEAQLREYYEEMKESMKRASTNYRMSHIIVELADDAEDQLVEQKREKIMEAKHELDNGSSWSEVVEKYSEAPEKDNDGDIGYYSVEMFKNDILEGTVPDELGGG